MRKAAVAALPARGMGAPLSGVRDRMMTAIARGHADLDWSALGLIAAEEAGLPSSLISQAR
jgi:hypothetical protein